MLVTTALAEGRLEVSSGRRELAATERRKEVAIAVRNVRHTFPGSPPVEALRGIDLTIHKGELVALLGQNGSGKTSLAYHLVGVLKPTNEDAEIRVGDVDVITAPLQDAIKTINYIFQNPSNQLFCETFEQEVAYGPRQLGWSDEKVELAIRDSLGMVGLEEMQKHYVADLTRSEETLLSMASVLSMQHDILIADEPTGGLDRISAQKVMEILETMCRQGRTVIFITHDMKLAAQYATRVIVLRQGQLLIDGTPREVFAQPEVLEEAKLYPPQITQLGQRLGRHGVRPDVLTIEEFLDIVDVEHRLAE
jgi:energy-coupling factor transport system ATP-binding protein